MPRRRLAAFGEGIAAGFLEQRGVEVVGRNVRVGRDEIDIVAAEGHRIIAVEVKTVAGGRLDDDPAHRFTTEKARRVLRASRELRPPAQRVDLVTVQVDRKGVAIRWVRGVGVVTP